MMLFDSPSFHKHPTAIETMHHSKPECLMFAFPSRYSTANGYSNKKQAVFTDAPNDRCPQKLSSFRCLRCSSFIAQVIILSDPRAGAIRAGSELTVLCCLVSWGLGCGTLDGPS